MGQEETAPLNEPQQVPQEYIPRGYAYPNVAGEFYSVNGYSQVPVYGPSFQENQPSTNSYPVQYGHPSVSGYAPHALYHPILQRRKDNLGSPNSTIIGGLLGFFFPMLSLVILCCSSKLRLKHGICVGQVINYLLAIIAIIIIGTMVSNQIPLACHNMDSCLTDVTNGTDSLYWSNFVVQCNDTKYHNHNHNHTEYHDVDTSSDRSDHHISISSRRKPHPYNYCELPPIGADMNSLGPQTTACASCVCELKLHSCQALNSLSSMCWIVGPIVVLLAVAALYMNKYYKRLISVDSMSVYRL